MAIEAFGVTDLGSKRKQNEDAFQVDRELNLFVVCDGMGGHAAGEIASRQSVDFICEFIRTRLEVVEEAASAPGGYFKVVELVERATIATCEHIYENACSDTNLAGMGTTLTLLMIVDNKGIMSHVGDSRLYLMRNERLHMLSSDHTLVNDMIQRGVMSLDELDASPYKNVLTRSVGSTRAVESEMLLFDLLPGDTFLVCSDGLSNYIEDDQELADYLASENLAGLPGQLVDLANLRGGKDNITAVVVRYSEDSEFENESHETRVKTSNLLNSFLGKKLSFNRLLRLADIAELFVYDQGIELARVGDPCNGAFLIVRGKIRCDQDSTESRIMNAGDCFFESALVHKRTSKARVTVVEPSTILFIPRERFKRLSKQYPKFGQVLYERLLTWIVQQLDQNSIFP